MKKILIVANSDVGLYRFRKELIVKILEEEHKLIICCPKGQYYDELITLGNGNLKFIDYAIDRRGTNIISEVKLFNHYLRVIRKEKPDKILTYTIKPNIYVNFISKILRKECIPELFIPPQILI